MRQRMVGMIIALVMMVLILSGSGCANLGHGTLIDVLVDSLVGGAAGAGAGALLSEEHGKGAIVGGVTGAVATGAASYAIRKQAQKSTAQQATAEQATQDTLVVNVPNSDSVSFTPVQLKRQGNLWYGPQGETYQSIPTGEQLRARYGR